MTYGMHQPIPGGSEYRIEYDGPKQREVITIYLPPVGYTIDRMPNPETGVPSYQLIKCEILGEDLPVEQQKWKRPVLPKNWYKWRAEEHRQRKFSPDYIHPEAERFRAQEWTRRINGVWLALGNKEGKPTQYIYIPPSSYLYFAWWKADFGHPLFRLVYLKTFYALQWAEDHPLVNGIILSTYRRHGKTAIGGCWTFDKPSRMKNGYGGMQGQSGDKAVDFFDINLMQPFLALEPDFFKPRYDKMASRKKKLEFTQSIGERLSYDDFELLEKLEGTSQNLGSRIQCVNSKETSLDGRKMHRIWLEEPGKWIKVNVLNTVLKYVPCTKDDLRRKIGLIFVPSTVDEMDQGGEEFVELFEKSVPSLMKKNKNGKTGTELVSIFIPAYEGVIFDEYGRSVIDDPEPGRVLLDESGKQITEGAKTYLMRERDSKETEQERVIEIRQYPWSWYEAKMVMAVKCQFNAMILTDRLMKLRALPRMPWIRGNYEWVNEEDGDVEFFRDDIAGRFQVHWMPDKTGTRYEDSDKVLNNVGYEWVDKKKLWLPRNNRLFACGCDPIAYKARGIDPRLSNGAAYIFRKYDQTIDGGKPMNEWVTHNFVVQYLFRPDDFEVFGEDMIKMCRYWGVSINAEDNVQSLRQHFDGRGYGSFILYRRDFDDHTLMGNKDMDRPIRSNPEVIDTGVRKLNTFFNRHGHRVVFPELLEQGLQFDPNNTQKSDAIVAGYYTMMAVEKPTDLEDGKPIELESSSLFQLYDVSGERSVPVKIQSPEKEGFPKFL